MNITLAGMLGATIVPVKADGPADGLIALLSAKGLTYVIVDQTAHAMGAAGPRSTLDKFLGAVPDAAVQVVPLVES